MVIIRLTNRVTVRIKGVKVSKVIAVLLGIYNGKDAGISLIPGGLLISHLSCNLL